MPTISHWISPGLDRTRTTHPVSDRGQCSINPGVDRQPEETWSGRTEALQVVGVDRMILRILQRVTVDNIKYMSDTN